MTSKFTKPCVALSEEEVKWLKSMSDSESISYVILDYNFSNCKFVIVDDIVVVDVV